MIKTKIDKQGRLIVISVAGGKPETYATIGGEFISQLLNNIRFLNEIKEDVNSPLHPLTIEFVDLKRNATDLEKLAELACKLGAARVLIANVPPYAEEMKVQVISWANCLWTQDIIRCP